MVCILAVLLCAGSPENPPAERPAKVLTSAREVRRVTPDRAAQGPPVRLEAVITYNDGDVVFVQDATAGTHVHKLPHSSDWKCGYRMRIEGQTMPGVYVPGINASRAELLGPGTPPDPLPVTIDELMSGIYHYQMVEMEGIGRSAIATGENMCIIRLAVGSRTLEVRVAEIPPRGFDLVDARVRVRGLAAGVINNRRQLVSPYIKVRSFEDVVLIDAPRDPAGLPVVPVDELLRYTPEGASGRRVKVRGVILASLPNEPVFIREGERAIMVESKPTDSLQPGDAVEVVGFPEMGPYRAFVADATFRRIGRETLPAPRRMSIAELLSGAHDADLVELEGYLVASYSSPESLTLVVQEGNTIFRVRARGGPSTTWIPGSRLAVGGLCRVAGSTGKSNRDYVFKPVSFELWADSPDRIRLLGMPSWWTPRRLTGALGILIALTAAALVWNFVLRRRVRTQTAVIRAQLAREVVLEERQRIAREVHDSLEQELVGLSLRLDAAVAVADGRTFGLLDTTRRLVGQIQSEVRNLVWNLREQDGGAGELAHFIRRLATELLPATTRLDVVVRGEPWPLPGPVEHNLLRITQEAVTNALKHADPSTLEIVVAYDGDRLSLRVHDDGRGFDDSGQVEAKPGHFGLVGMRERARKIAARLAIESVPGRGTTVEVKVARPSRRVRESRDGSIADLDPGGG